LFAVLGASAAAAAQDPCAVVFTSGFEASEQADSLRPGCAALSGYLLDRSGVGDLLLPGARVIARKLDEPERVYVQTTSDVAGRYRIAALPVGVEFNVSVEPEGLASSRWDTPIRRFATSQRITLDGEFEGRLDFSVGGAEGHAFDPSTQVRLGRWGAGGAEPAAGEVELPANSLQRADGSAPHGGANVFLQPIDVSLAQSGAFQAGLDVFPGNMTAEQQDGSPTNLISLGAMNVEFFDATGEPLNLASGTTATVRVPVPDSLREGAPDSLPLWWFDVARGLWVEQGSAQLSGDRSYYQGSVAHFTTWNADVPVTVARITGEVRYADGGLAIGSLLRLTGDGYAYSTASLVGSDGRFVLRARRGYPVRIEVVAPGARQSFSRSIADSENVDLGLLQLDSNLLDPGHDPLPLSFDVQRQGTAAVYLGAAFATGDIHGAGGADATIYHYEFEGTNELRLEFPFAEPGSSSPDFNYGIQRVGGTDFESLTMAPEGGYQRDCFSHGGSEDPQCIALPAPYLIGSVDGAVYATRNRAGNYAKFQIQSVSQDPSGNWRITLRYRANVSGGREL
jgi:hypothetical protein